MLRHLMFKMTTQPKRVVELLDSPILQKFDLAIKPGTQPMRAPANRTNRVFADMADRNEDRHGVQIGACDRVSAAIAFEEGPPQDATLRRKGARAPQKDGKVVRAPALTAIVEIDQSRHTVGSEARVQPWQSP